MIAVVPEKAASSPNVPDPLVPMDVVPPAAAAVHYYYQRSYSNHTVAHSYPPPRCGPNSKDSARTWRHPPRAPVRHAPRGKPAGCTTMCSWWDDGVLAAALPCRMQVAMLPCEGSCCWASSCCCARHFFERGGCCWWGAQRVGRHRAHGHRCGCWWWWWMRWRSVGIVVGWFWY